MTNGIHPFTSDKELTRFARKFLWGRVCGIRKDIAICLTANKQRGHAYFPALMTCITFLDLLSGLYAGKLRGQGLDELVDYARTFMNTNHYDELRLAILYECFRHKIAHLSHPYVVLDTTTSRKIPKPGMRVTWTVCANDRSVPIELVSYPSARILQRTRTPWPVKFDSRVTISIHRLKVDAIKSIYRPSGYFANLKTDRSARERFARCMSFWFPP